MTPEREARLERKRAKERVRRARIKEAEAMAKIHNRVGTDDPPSAHERMKVEAWKAANPSQLGRFNRLTRKRIGSVTLSMSLSPTTLQNLQLALGGGQP